MSHSCIPCGSTPTRPVYAQFPPPVGVPSSSSSTTGTTGSTATTCPEGTALPQTAAEFTAPALNNPGQLNSVCASRWAIPGNDLSIAPLGNLRITGVNGDVISFINLTIAPGTIVIAGSKLFQSVSQQTASTTPAAQLSLVQGFTNGSPTTLAPQPFNLLRGAQVGSELYFQNLAAQVYFPLAAPVLLDDPSNSTNPLASGVPTVTPTYALPGLPSPLPAAFSVLLSIELQNPTAETVVANGFVATANGVEIARLQYIAGATFAVVKATSASLQIQFAKVAARAACVAKVYVHGYFA